MPDNSFCMQSNSYREEGDELFPADGSAEDDGGDRLTEEGREGEPEEEEVKAIRSPIIPNTPSQEEVRRHRITHRPFRSWSPPLC